MVLVCKHFADTFDTNSVTIVHAHKPELGRDAARVHLSRLEFNRLIKEGGGR